MQKCITMIIGLIFIITTISGCSERMRRKFIRKPKSKAGPLPQAITLKEYKVDLAKKDLYENHFNFWKLWQWELIRLLDERSDFTGTPNKKRIGMYAENAVLELKSMQELVGEGKGRELDDLVNLLNEFSAKLSNNTLSQNEKFRITKDIKREARVIERNFSPAKVVGIGL